MIDIYIKFRHFLTLFYLQC